MQCLQNTITGVHRIMMSITPTWGQDRDSGAGAFNEERGRVFLMGMSDCAVVEIYWVRSDSRATVARGE